eukprot:TRINITY_DN10835_c0_g3_i1.p1 TRINITY_DN10835_c0_g3~~TRINITY_DN10835_c0_g3_i1.p1  ORF type:complete len:155 (-),score=35.11 TRINITY_DN10835_c0_g3_i1:28-492(-)
MIFKCRANNSVNRKAYLDAVSEMIGKQHFADAANPQLTLLIEICQDLLCFTIIENYKEYMKYNLQELTKSFLAEEAKGEEQIAPKVQEDHKSQEPVSDQDPNNNPSEKVKDEIKDEIGDKPKDELKNEKEDNNNEKNNGQSDEEDIKLICLLTP